MTQLIADIAVLANAGTAIRARKGQPLMLVHVQHKNGIWWFDAPLPRRWHKCKTWTLAILGTGIVRRCACGAINWNGGVWIEKNSERKSAKGKVPGTKGNDSASRIPQTIPKHSGGNRGVRSGQSGGIPIKGSVIQHSSGDSAE